jgi:cyclic pyranopterin phosphate synthase
MQTPLCTQEENFLLRVKIMSACNLACVFCHNEGTHKMFPSMNISQFQEVLDFADNYGFQEIHFTGGEPTLNHHLPTFIAMAKKAGMETGMTTNAQFKSQEIPQRLFQAGLDSINISLHSIRPEGWAVVQNTDPERAQKQLTSTLTGIDSCLEVFGKIKMNIVVSDFGSALEVLDYAASRSISPRLLDVLGSQASLITIADLLHHINGELIQTIDTVGTSQRKCIYKTDKELVVVKEIRDFTISSICDGSSRNCFEKFYGVRIEAQRDTLFARLCLCHESPNTLIPLDFFGKSQQLVDILAAGRKVFA